MRCTIWAVALILASIATLECRAADRTWSNPSGGVFSDGANWSTGIPPAAGDRAMFGIVVMPPAPGSPVPVSFTANATNDRLRVSNGNVSLDLNGSTYELTHPFDGTYTGQAPDSVALLVGDLASSNAVLTITDGTLQSNFAHIGNRIGSMGTVLVTGVGSTMTNNSPLTVGAAGTGFLSVHDGGFVQSVQSIIGRIAGSQGFVDVVGADSSWLNSDTLFVGDAGTGALTISDGAIVSAINHLIGNLAGSQGTVTITGAGSAWTNTNPVSIGVAGTGILNIQNGAGVGTALGASIGELAGSDGTATVSGTDSVWEISGYLLVGESGEGELTIEDGGEVVNGDVYLGFNSNSHGAVVVKDVGSLWTCEAGLRVGNAAGSSLQILGGGVVTSGSLWIGNSANGVNATGSIIVDGSGSKLESGLNVQVERGSLAILAGGSISAVNLDWLKAQA